MGSPPFLPIRLLHLSRWPLLESPGERRVLVRLAGLHPRVECCKCCETLPDGSTATIAGLTPKGMPQTTARLDQMGVTQDPLASCVHYFGADRKGLLSSCPDKPRYTFGAKETTCFPDARSNSWRSCTMAANVGGFMR